MNPDATGFKTERLNELNRRGASTVHAEERVFPREFAGGVKRVPVGRVLHLSAGSEDPAYTSLEIYFGA
jgi:hypothetical protein